MTESVATPTGIHGDNVTAWLRQHAPTSVAPFNFELIAGGHSNLTFKVTDAAGSRWVLRRPPMFQVLATAHDMEREHRIMAALGDSDVPVPTMVGLCKDDEVNERPFYVMEFVDGTIVRDEATASTFEPATRRRMAEQLMKVMATIHSVDVDAVGLGELGKKEDYIARQLRRWKRQFEESKIEERPLFDELHAHLESRIPEQLGATIVHGDYRLDNCMVSDDGDIAAVLDWELCTLGDRFADVSGLLIYWTEPGDERQALDESPTAAGGFPTRQEMIDLYAEASGLSLDNIDYYLAFSSWRLASIIEGVNSRYVKGAMGDKDADDHQFVERINGLLASAAEYAANVP